WGTLWEVPNRPGCDCHDPSAFVGKNTFWLVAWTCLGNFPSGKTDDSFLSSRKVRNVLKSSPSRRQFLRWHSRGLIGPISMEWRGLPLNDVCLIFRLLIQTPHLRR